MRELRALIKSTILIAVFVSSVACSIYVTYQYNTHDVQPENFTILFILFGIIISKDE